MSHRPEPERVRNCPVCGAAMEKVVESGLTLDRCLRQHGSWFDGGELRAFAKAHGKYQLYESDARRRVTLTDDQPRRCPACEDRSLHAGLVQDFEVEVCDVCGGFFLPIATSHRLHLLGAVRREGQASDVIRGVLDVANLVELLTMPLRW